MPWPPGPSPPSLGLSDICMASHGTARYMLHQHAQLLCGSVTSLESCKHQHYVPRATVKCAHAHARSCLRGAREPTMRAPFAPAHPTPPSQPAQTITGPGPDGFKLIKEDADHLEHHRAENAGVQLRGCSASCRSLLYHQDRHNRGRLAAEMVHLDVAAARRSLRRSLGGTRSPTASPRHACEQPSW